MSNDTSYSLLEKAIHTDNDGAWSELDSRYRAFICHIIRSFQISDNDFDDLVQQVMIKLMNSLKSYDREKGQFRNWLAALVRSKCLMYFRTQKKELKHKDALEKQANLATEDEPSKIDSWIASEWEDYVSTIALDRVRESYRGKSVEVFEMLLEGMTIEEVMEKTGLTLQTVYTMKARVKKSVMFEIRSVVRDLEGR